MKIVIIGAGGNIGRIITPALLQQHEVITVGRNSADIKADISDAAAIEALFNKTGTADAVICVAGDSKAGALYTLQENEYATGIHQKLLSQINLVLIGKNYMTERGAFILISGKTGDSPSIHTSAKAIVNGAINSFVKAASLEMQGGLRINAVSPARLDLVNPGELIAAYRQCLETEINGQILKIGY